jgi:hypothetical protein
MTVIRFKIGEAFAASDPVARFITGLAMISNDWLRSMKDLLELESDTPEEQGRRVSLSVAKPRWSMRRLPSSRTRDACSPTWRVSSTG